MQPVRIHIATADIESIAARKGDYVLEPQDGTGALCVFHGARAATMTPEDRARLIAAYPIAV